MLAYPEIEINSDARTMRFQISTEKVGDCVLLSIDDMADMPEIKKKAGLRRGPGNFRISALVQPSQLLQGLLWQSKHGMTHKSTSP